MKSLIVLPAVFGALLLHPLETARADTIEIEDGGYRRTFELFWDISNGDSFQERDAGDLDELLAPVALNQGNEILVPAVDRAAPRIVLYETTAERTPFTRRILTNRLLARVEDFGVLQAFLKVSDAIRVGRVAYAPGYFLVTTQNPLETLSLATRLRKVEGVLSAEPLLGRLASRKFLPNDPFFFNAWHLLNWGQLGGARRVDLNVTNVWDRFRGSGIVVAIVDDGLQRTHPDLSANIRRDVQYDFRDDDGDPSPSGSEDFHGTAVAGIVAGRGDNDTGVTGVAYEASLVGIRLVGGIDQTDEQDAAAMLRGHEVISVSNNAWGAEDSGRSLEGPGPLMSAALEKAVREGRGGKGMIFVWAGGNGAELQDNANYDGYANSIYTMAVGAVNDLGKRAPYSEPGACLVLCGPSSDDLTSDRAAIVTTDLTGDEGLNFQGAPGDTLDVNYTQTFGGTSASSAMISGVAALILEANPELSWRDVQEILMRSATKVDPDNPGWKTNGSGFHFNHEFGAGLANAGAAVELASNWELLEAQRSFVFDQTGLSERIPDGQSTGITRSFFVPYSRALRAEHVTVSVAIKHPRRGDLAVSLISPRGTESRLAERHLDFNSDYRDWKFMSVFHWGESTGGQWKLRIVDSRRQNAGVLESFRVEIFGTTPAAESDPTLVALGYSEDGFQFRTNGNEGRPFDVQVSSDLTTWTKLFETNVAAGVSIALEDFTAGDAANRFYRLVGRPDE